MGSLIISSLGGKLHNSHLTQARVFSEAGYGIGLNSEQWSALAYCWNGRGLNVESPLTSDAIILIMKRKKIVTGRAYVF